MENPEIDEFTRTVVMFFILAAHDRDGYAVPLDCWHEIVRDNLFPRLSDAPMQWSAGFLEGLYVARMAALASSEVIAEGVELQSTEKELPHRDRLLRYLAVALGNALTGAKQAARN